MFNFLLDILFPPKENAVLARRATPEALARALAPRTCNLHTFALFPFEDPLIRALIHEMKYRGSQSAPRLLAGAAAPALAEMLADRYAFEEYRHALLVPMPLHARKERERGFNQSKRLGEAFIRAGVFPEQALAPHILARTRDTKSQTQLHSKNARRENVLDAFTARAPFGGAGRDIVLLDDVITSGATLAEARRTLLSLGATKVFCVAIAYA